MRFTIPLFTLAACASAAAVPNPEISVDRATIAERDPVAYWDIDFVRNYFDGGFVETVSAKFISDKYPTGLKSFCKTQYYNGNGPVQPNCTPGYFHYKYDLSASTLSVQQRVAQPIHEIITGSASFVPNHLDDGTLKGSVHIGVNAQYPDHSK